MFGRSMRAVSRTALISGAAFFVIAAAGSKLATTPAGRVNALRLNAAGSDTANWMSYGRTYDEQRFAPISQLNPATVAHLALAWHADFDTDRGQEATPLIVDGVIYVSTAWSMVKAYDARSGKLLWSYDPKVPKAWAVNACCDVVNRGVAVWNGKVFVGTLDGRLVAIDAATGKRVWETLTIDPTKPYTITGAPRVVKGRVLIGNGGAEYGVRGYLSAYDAETGKLDWRFYVVPGDPSKPFESPELAKAAKTWAGDWWKLGGGGTVWDAVSYDPKLDLLYIGTGNGGPWSRKIRSEGKGDNLFLSSIVAVRPETGAYVWHYQETPGDEWDYTATQQIILADLMINGRLRKVLMQAPKNGFFYVLDRATGELLSATPFVKLNWATGVDMRTGRPMEVPGARYSETGVPWNAMPDSPGAHSWYPMAYSPLTKLVYIPVQEIGGGYETLKDYKPHSQGWNTGTKFGEDRFPTDPHVVGAIRASLKGYILAWDPVQKKAVFRIAHQGPFNGGLLVTGGNLLFQGDASGHFNAYRADTGAPLWRFDAQSAITGGPITYALDGQQYVAVLSGWGGIAGLFPGQLSDISGPQRNISRLLVFRVGGRDRLPPTPARPAPGPIAVLPDTGTPAVLESGHATFGHYCSVCHGVDAVSSGLVPDLRHSGALGRETFNAIVHDGALQDAGMVSFAKVLSSDQIEAVRLYIIDEARRAQAAGAR